MTKIPLRDRLTVSPLEAGELLGIGRSTMYTLIKNGELPTVTIGTRERIPMEELERWVRTRTRHYRQAAPPPEGEEQP